ncbi:MAG: hypothetical protein Q4D04_04345 [Clostridia bacterium]|nr:hypothetical protein [Clostridia bacterium]
MNYDEELKEAAERHDRAAQPRKTLGDVKRSLYDKIKIPVRTMDIIIYIIIGLIAVALILGIAMGGN